MIILALLVFISCQLSLKLVSPSSAFDVDVDNNDGLDEIVLQTSIYQEFDSDFYSDMLIGDTENLEVAEELLFQPESLVFMDSPLAIAETASFLIVNHHSYDIHVYSVVSESPLFHPVMFQPQVVAPQQSISLQILFLPYYQENVVSELQIKTSLGDYAYQVKGFPVRNPYGLHSLVGIRIPSYSRFEQPLVVHNPHNQTLHIKEVYTTESFLTLKGAPLRRVGGMDGGDDVDQSSFPPELMWELQPGVEREVITLSVPSTLDPGLYHGYVHIKTDHDNMVLPVEIEVMEGAVYAAQQSLDFGILTAVNERKTIDLRLFNTGFDFISVTEIIPVNSDPHLIVSLADNPVIPPREPFDVSVATLTFTSSSPGKVVNKLLVVTNNTNAALAVIELVYTATVLHGGVGFEHQKAIFVAPVRNQSSVSLDNGSPAAVVQRTFLFTNYFNAHISLNNVVVASCNDIFSTSGVGEEVAVDSFGVWPPVVLEFRESVVSEHSKRDANFLPKTCWLEVFTNISSHRIPIYIIDGSLELVFMDAEMMQLDESVSGSANSDEYHIDLGSISVEQPRLLRVAFANENPARIPLELLNATDGVCICSEASWPIGNNDEEAAQVHLSAVTQRVLDDARCSCCHGGSVEVPEELRSFGVAKSGYNSLFSISFHNLMANFGSLASASRNEVVVTLGSPYQRIVLHLHFTMAKGKFVTLAVPAPRNSGKFWIGRHDVFKVVTILDFEEPVHDIRLTTTSAVMTYQTDEHLGSIDRLKSFTTSLFPSNLCTNSALRADGANMSASLWSCSQEAIRASSAEHRYSKIMKYLRRLEDAMSLPNDPVQFHKDSLRLKRMWSRTAARGIPLSASEFVVHSAQALHRFPLQNTSIQSPILHMPDSYKVALPVFRPTELVWFYVVAHNPFSFPLMFTTQEPPLAAELEAALALNGSSQSQQLSSRSIYDCATVTKTIEAEEGSESTKADQEVADLSSYEECALHFSYSDRVTLFDAVSVHAMRVKSTAVGELVHPFYTLEASTAWVVQPLKNATLGPFVVNRRFHSDSSVQWRSLFIFNNFTGSEKLEVQVGVGDALVTLSDLSTVHNDSSREMVFSASPIRTSSSEWRYEAVSLGELGQQYFIHAKNVGPVNATAVDVIIDGVSCQSKATSGFFGSATKNALCQLLPVELAPNSEVTVALLAPSSCGGLTKRSLNVTLKLDEESTLSDEIFITVTLEPSSALLEVCQGRFGGKFYRLALRVLAAVVVLAVIGVLLFQIARRYLKWMRFCRAKQATNFQNSEILLRSSFALNAFLLHNANRLGLQFVVDSLIYGSGAPTTGSPQKRKYVDAERKDEVDPYDLHAAVDANRVDRRNSRTIDLRDVMLPEGSAPGDDLDAFVGSLTHVGRLLRDREGRSDSRPQTKSISVESTGSDHRRTHSKEIPRSLSEEVVKERAVTLSVDSLEQAAAVLPPLAQTSPIERVPLVPIRAMVSPDTTPQELAVSTDHPPVDADSDNDTPIYEYHGELLNSDDALSSAPNSPMVRPAAAPVASQDASPDSKWFGNITSGGPLGGMRSASPAFPTGFADDFTDRRDSFGDVFGGLSLLDLTSSTEVENIDFSSLGYSLPVMPALPPPASIRSAPQPFGSNHLYPPPQQQTRGNYQRPAPPPGFSSTSYRGQSKQQQQPLPFQQQQVHRQQQQFGQQQFSAHANQSFQRSGYPQAYSNQSHHPSADVLLDTDPDLAWVSQLTHDYVSDEEYRPSRGPGLGAVSSSPRSQQPKQQSPSETNQYWQQMNSKPFRSSSDDRDKRFFGPNSFFGDNGGRGEDLLESLEPEEEDTF